MYSILQTLIGRLDSSTIAGTNVIRWGAPIPSFGDVSNSRVATLGLNPSNREFVDTSNNELQGGSRRFHTLGSLGVRSWAEVDTRHLDTILDSCRSYFRGNPYAWFKRLDRVISGTKASYYHPSEGACHLDLVPFATECKWTRLTAKQRSSLLAISGDSLGLLLRDSPVRVLILNGRAVVEQFQNVSGTRLQSEVMPGWSLRRKSRADVAGIAYIGVVNRLLEVNLRHDIVVLGFNHNLQSSFGVTTEVIHAIGNWITQAAGVSR